MVCPELLCQRETLSSYVDCYDGACAKPLEKLNGDMTEAPDAYDDSIIFRMEDGRAFALTAW